MSSHKKKKWPVRIIFTCSKGGSFQVKVKSLAALNEAFNRIAPYPERDLICECTEEIFGQKISSGRMSSVYSDIRQFWTDREGEML